MNEIERLVHAAPRGTQVAIYKWGHNDNDEWSVELTRSGDGVEVKIKAEGGLADAIDEVCDKLDSIVASKGVPGLTGKVIEHKQPRPVDDEIPF